MTNELSLNINFWLKKSGVTSPMITLSLKFINLPQKHQKKTFLLQKNVAVLVLINILWLYCIIWDWFRKHLINLLVLSLWSWCCLCFVILPVAPHPDHIIDKQWCLQVFPCIRLSQHSVLKLLKEKMPQFQMQRKWIFFLHSWLSLTLSWHCAFRNDVTLPRRADEFGPQSWDNYFS